MTPFGSSTQQQQTDEAATGERWELRTITIVDGQEKQTRTGKVYWRVKDSNNHWYSVWEDSTKITLETAADNGQAIPCAVQIKPGKNGGAPFYTITTAGAAAEQVVAEGKAKAAADSAPGGKNSAFQKRMHPDDALRVTYLNLFQHAERMAEFTADERPQGTSKESWLKAKIPEYASFLGSIVEMPKTPQDNGEPAPTPVGPTSSAEQSQDYPVDDDIPI